MLLLLCFIVLTYKKPEVGTQVPKFTELDSFLIFVNNKWYRLKAKIRDRQSYLDAFNVCFFC